MRENTDKYTLYVFHRSYFCGKMLAYLRYKNIPHEAIYKPLSEVGSLLMQHTGLRQMPVIETPDGKWLQDTTPMIEWFETEYPQSSVFPSHPVGRFFARLLEDYADEWLWRPAIYYRWQRPEDRFMYKSLFVDEFVGGFWTLAKPLKWLGGQLVHKHQRDKFLEGDGITPQNREHVEDIYIRTLAHLENIFQQQAFVMGERPSMADFGFFGSMFWHFGNDPTPNRIMQERAPAVYEWVARMWNAKSDRLGDLPFNLREDGVPLGCEALIKEVSQHYLPYLALNAQEYAKESQTFDWHIEGYTYPRVHVSPYRVWCRERLQRFFHELKPEEQETVRTELSRYGDANALLSDTQVESNWDPENKAPFCTEGRISLKHKLLARFTGTNHVRSRRLWTD